MSRTVPTSPALTSLSLAALFLSLTPLVVRAEDAAAGLRAMPIPEDNGVHVTLGDVTDDRRTGKNFARLELEIKTEGDALMDAFGVMKPVITAAVDDTGRSLIKDDKKADPMFWSFEAQDKPRRSVEARAELLNPARKATSISVMGQVTILNPKLDPASILTVTDLPAQAGKPLLPAAFQKTGMEITVMTKPLADKMKQEKAAAEAQKVAAKPGDAAGQALGQAFGKMFESMFSGFFTMGENDLLFVIKDPQRQIAALQVLDAEGKPIKTGGGRSMSQDEASGTTRYSLGFAAALPANAQLKIYFLTPKSGQQVPFKFENVRLP